MKFARDARFFVVWCVPLVFSLYRPAKAVTFAAACPNSKDIFPADLQHRSMKSSWQKDYPMLIFDEAAYRATHKITQDIQGAEDKVNQAQSALDDIKKDINHTLDLLTVRPNDSELKEHLQEAQIEQSEDQKIFDDAKTALDSVRNNASGFHSSPYLYWKEANNDNLSPLPNRSFVPQVYLTEKVLVLVCNAEFGDASATDQTSVAANGTETEQLKLIFHTAEAIPGTTIDRIYALEQKITDNAITVVNFTQKDATTSAVDPVAVAVVERHHRIRFSAGGGMLLTYATPTSYSIMSAPTTVTTTTSTTTTTTSSTGTTTTTTATPVVTNSTTEYVLGTKGDSPQLNGVAGVTFYPFGHDTFPVGGRRFTANYAFYRPYQDIGLFVGTSVSSLGNFTVAPAFELYPGIQIFGGPTWWSKATLQPNITACSGYGTSPSFQYLPTQTTTSTSTTTGSSPSTTTTTTTVSVTATSGCANGDKATILAGSAVPTQNSLQRSWGFGFVFNTNLFKAFSGLVK